MDLYPTERKVTEREILFERRWDDFWTRMLLEVTTYNMKKTLSPDTFADIRFKCPVHGVSEDVNNDPCCDKVTIVITPPIDTGINVPFFY